MTGGELGKQVLGDHIFGSVSRLVSLHATRLHATANTEEHGCMRNQGESPDVYLGRMWRMSGSGLGLVLG